MYKCPISNCKYESKRSADVKRHLAAKACKLDERLLCKFCGKRSTRLFNNRKHENVCKGKQKIEVDTSTGVVEASSQWNVATTNAHDSLSFGQTAVDMVSGNKEHRNESQPDKHDDNAAMTSNQKISIVNADTATVLPSPPKLSSKILFITNLVRPFTVLQLKDLLARTGKIVDGGFWSDKINSKCYVKYETEDEAIEIRNALHGVRWPASNPKCLNVDFGSEKDMDEAIASIDEQPPKEATRDERVASGCDRFEVDELKEPSATARPMREWDVGNDSLNFCQNAIDIVNESSLVSFSIGSPQLDSDHSFNAAASSVSNDSEKDVENTSPNVFAPKQKRVNLPKSVLAETDGGSDLSGASITPHSKISSLYKRKFNASALTSEGQEVKNLEGPAPSEVFISTPPKVSGLFKGKGGSAAPTSSNLKVDDYNKMQESMSPRVILQSKVKVSGLLKQKVVASSQEGGQLAVLHTLLERNTYHTSCTTLQSLAATISNSEGTAPSNAVKSPPMTKRKIVQQEIENNDHTYAFVHIQFFRNYYSDVYPIIVG